MMLRFWGSVAEIADFEMGRAGISIDRSIASLERRDGRFIAIIATPVSWWSKDPEERDLGRLCLITTRRHFGKKNILGGPDLACSVRYLSCAVCLTCSGKTR